MSKNKHIIFSLLFVAAMLLNALHTITDHHSHSDCQVCAVDDHSNGTPVSPTIPLNLQIQDKTLQHSLARAQVHIDYLLPYGHAPPLFLT